MATTDPAPPGAMQRDQRNIARLISHEKRRTLADFWLELTIAAVVALVAVPAIIIACIGHTAVVLVDDVRQGDRIAAAEVTGITLPHLPHAFAKADDVNHLVAVRDLPAGSVVRTTDVARPQVVATVNVTVGETLDPARNIAFKPLPYVEDALTATTALHGRAKQFIAAGTVIRASDITDAPAPPESVEVPLRAFVGPLAPAVGSEVTIVATPRGNGAGTLFQHVRLLAADSAREPAMLLVAMTKAEATRFAALPAADFTVMRPRR